MSGASSVAKTDDARQTTADDVRQVSGVQSVRSDRQVRGVQQIRGNQRTSGNQRVGTARRRLDYPKAKLVQQMILGCESDPDSHQMSFACVFADQSLLVCQELAGDMCRAAFGAQEICQALVVSPVEVHKLRQALGCDGTHDLLVALYDRCAGPEAFLLAEEIFDELEIAYACDVKRGRLAWAG